MLTTALPGTPASRISSVPGSDRARAPTRYSVMPHPGGMRAIQKRNIFSIRTARINFIRRISGSKISIRPLSSVIASGNGTWCCSHPPKPTVTAPSAPIPRLRTPIISPPRALPMQRMNCLSMTRICRPFRSHSSHKLPTHQGCS